MTPWLWAGRTKEVRTSGARDARRLAAIEGWVYTRSVKRKSMTFYFVYLKNAISVSTRYIKMLIAMAYSLRYKRLKNLEFSIKNN